MKNNQSAFQWFGHFIAASLLALGLAGCSGDDGSPGAPGTPGPGVAPLDTATVLNVTVTAASVNSAPVVNFKVTNQDGVAVAGLTEAMLRFNIAKLIPGTNGAPDHWQNYIYRNQSSSAHQGNQERSSGTGYRYGTLTNNLDGTYSYKFATDITNPADVVCVAPCTDVNDNPLDLSYNASLTHRVSVQVSGTTSSGSALPYVNATYDFVPSGGAMRTRDIVKTETCNECHGQLRVHGSRIETKLCVTCHNPGSWVNAVTTGTDPQPRRAVDFKVMVHKIHAGEELPSVLAGTKYKIGNSDYSNVVFPYSAVSLGDTRACAKCHDGAKTAQGDNWKNVPSKAACSACHDGVYFGNAPLNAWETESHIALAAAPPYNLVVGPDPTDDTCIQCHGAGQPADIKVKHDLPNLLKAEGAKYVFNVRSVTNSGPGMTPFITFSVDDASGTPYDIKTGAQFLDSNASLSLLLGWNNTDENNTGANNLGQPININLKGANAVVAGGNTYTVNMGTNVIPVGTTGSGRVAIYGRVGVDVDGNGTVDRVRVKAGFKDFAITDTAPVARRTVVDVNKCDACHDQVSLHGDSRTNEPGLCVMCHNPSATDLARRPRANLALPTDPGPCAGTAGALPNAVNCNPLIGGSVDSKKEEAVDFKRMIHGIHAAAKTDYTGAAAHGFRNKGLVVYGYFTGTGPANPVDFSEVRFPGILNNCLTCHITPTGNNRGSYELAGKWEVPTASGVLGSTINTAPLSTDSLLLQTDDLNITPTAAVCSSCHDGVVAKSHMELNGALFAATQATIDTGVVLEACAICHGPGRVGDVKLVHGVK
jgi:OmcA/MtrC family decaheme c-type cytochrome